ncbi:MAG TPA: cytochrome c oxidase subunit II [Tepidisphaeraceae bacterium]|jgi:heme/copper-type cytochrome/quinol oxidase subunit 2|nr:cytochrome c oxidase subunit II [Tepidisphaeraceae bacterium]
MLCTLAQLSPLPFANWSDWWLNVNYAEHGKSMDGVFYFVFWLTTFILVATQAVLIWFLIKYRFRADRKKGIYSHGNTRLEMTWTIIPAIILIVLAVWSRRVWDNYRYSATADDPNAPKILVIGEQFQWNVLYGGPRNKLGRYLLYPKVTDLKWPTVPDGQTFNFPNVPGPAYLPEQQALAALDDYISQINPLGRDYDDPDTNPDPTGQDAALAKLNDRNNALGRVLVLPKNRAVEIQLGSRDVIHDFFLPNFRTKLDVVPGMRGKLYITADSDCPGPKLYTLVELQQLVDRGKDVMAIVNKNTPGAELYSTGRRRPKFWRLTKDGETFLVNGTFITADVIKNARAAGISKITATMTYDLVCEELCGIGHSKMQGKVIVLDDATLKEPPYNNYFPPAVPASPAEARPAVLGATQR